MNMKLVLKILTFYIISFGIFLMFFMLCNLHNLPLSSSDLVVQNIISCDGHSANIFHNLAQQSTSLREEGTGNSLYEVIKSLKYDIYPPRYKANAWYATSNFHRSEGFDKPLTLYNGKDFNLMQSLFSTSDGSLLDDRIEKQIEVKLQVTKSKLIVISSTDIDVNQDSFLQSNCNVNNCHFTNNISLAENADAIIFQSAPISMTSFLSKARRNQIWIYHNIESPLHSTGFTDTFRINWTATYKANSVLPTPYGKFLPFRDVRRLPKTTRNFAKGRTKFAAIFVSNCYSKNGRLNYVKELKKYAKIDVYGDCGDKKCANKDCFEMLKRDYKFYLAFENSNCREYITEKFFHNALQHDVIPIVMGAHPDDYKRVAPPNSFIHVDEFDSPRQLAEYMHILDNNDDLYNEYFRWKDTGKFINTKFACRMCVMLQIAPIFPPKSIDINEIQRREAENECIVPSLLSEKWKRWK